MIKKITLVGAQATVSVAGALRKKCSDYHLIVVLSTVLPTTTRTRIIPLLEKHSTLKAGEHFGVCMNPEFGRQASALQNFLNPNRIVIRELDKRSGDLLESLYTSLKAPIIRTNLDTAEMTQVCCKLLSCHKNLIFQRGLSRLQKASIRSASHR